MFLSSLDLHCAGPLALWGFSLRFPVNIGETKKNSQAHHLNAGPPGTAPLGTVARVYCLTFIKSFGKEVDFEYQRIESISNFAASIDIFKVFYLTVKHIVIKIERFRPKAVKPSSG